jgi:hypothetical protein
MRSLTLNEVQSIAGGEAMTLRIDGCYTAQQWRDISEQVSREATRAGLVIGALSGILTGLAVGKFSNPLYGVASGAVMGIASGIYSYVQESRSSELWPLNY